AVRTGGCPVALNDAVLHVRCDDVEMAIRVPFAGGVAVPSVFRIVRWMVAAVDIDDAIGAAEHASHGVRNMLLGDRMEDLQDAEVGLGSAHMVLNRVRLRLPLRLRQDGGVPM